MQCVSGLSFSGTSKEKIYQEFGFEFLRVPCWYRKLYLFNKVLNNKYPKQLFNLIPVSVIFNALKIPLLNTNHNFTKLVFSIHLRKLIPGLRKSETQSLLKTNILTIIRSPPNSTIVIILKDLNLLLFAITTQTQLNLFQRT